MSVIYNVACNTRIAVQQVSIQGGDVISATPSKLYVCQGSTNTLIVYGAYDIEEGSFWVGSPSGTAQISGTLLDQYGNEIFTLALNYVSGSNGQFQADFGGFSFMPALGTGYTLVIQGTDQNGNDLSISLLAEVVNTPRVTGVITPPNIPSP